MFHHEVGPVAGGLNLLMLIAFGLSVAVQYNDPEPWLWSLFYLLAVLACLGFHFGILHWQLAAAMATVALAAALWLLPQFLGQVSPAEIVQSLQMKTEGVEEAREAGGSMLVAGWMAFLAWHVRNRGGADRGAAS